MREIVRKSAPVKTILIVFCCVVVNFLGKHFAAAMQLPLWLDCLGTVFAAYILGPVSGAVVGCTGNIIYSFWNSESLVYGLISILIGIITGVAARKKYFDSFFKATSLAGGVAIASALISTVLNMLLYGGSTGNIWGDGVRYFLLEEGLADIWASAAGELYLDFLDKLVTVLSLFYLLLIRKRLRGRWKKRRAAAVVSAAFVLAGMLAMPISARAESLEEPSYIRQVYDSDNGLPGGHANDIVQTNDGILWIGTNSGLYRYTGGSFRRMDSFNTVKNVNCLYVDQEGRLWIGTNDSGLALSINGKFTNTIDSTSGLPSDCVTGIVQGADGDYYVGTDDRMAVVRISIGMAVVNTIEGVRGARCVCADTEGSVAAVTAQGNLVILKEQKVLWEVSNPSGSAVFSACAFDENDILYAGTSDGCIQVYRIGDDGLERLKTIACEGTSVINQIFFDQDAAWILSENGIGTLQKASYQRMDTGGFDAAVRRMAVDYQGHFWFASSQLGLLQLSETAFPNLNSKYGLPAETVYTTCVDNGVLYIGTDTGVKALALSAGRAIQNALTESLYGSKVSCIINASDGGLWIGSGKGLLHVSPAGEITAQELGGPVSLCLELSDGSIAAAGECGLTLTDGKNARTLPYGDELGTAQILSACERSDGSLLLGTDGNGIVVVKDGSVTGRIGKEDGLTSGVVRRIVHDDVTDALFVVTGNGLCYMNGVSILPIEGFPYTDNFDIVIKNGVVFVLGSAGIYTVHRDVLLSGKSSITTLLDIKSGFEGALTGGAHNAVTKSGMLYLSTYRGVVRMDMNDYWSDKRSYRLMVSEIRLDGKTVPIERGSGLSISRDVSTIEFIPEIVNYSLYDPKVSYYLEGVDSGYKTVAQNELSSVVYTNLPSGDYVFHLAVIDENTGAIWEESTYRFTKEKSIQDNDWFIVYMLGIGGLFVGWFVWFVTRISLQQTIKIQQERLALALKQVQMGNETILAIAKTVDAKDVLTSKHSQRVSEYSVLIAKKLGFSEDEQENLRKAALLHDIGKIGIPDSILNKPARLTDEEYAIMKTHVTRGAEILKDFTLIEHVVDGARYHHERFDGKGYPDGLAGGDIPLYGRIIAVADAFDAMTANRVYRKRQSFSYVVSELQKGRGTQFDPELIDAFLDAVNSGEIDVAALYSEEATETGGEQG